MAPIGSQRAIPWSVPAPLGGWNTRDALAAMPKTDAVVLENWIPGTSEVTTREGSTDWSTGFAKPPLSLLPYNGQAVQKLFAATDDGIFDITAGGAIGAAVVALASGQVEYAMMTSAGGHFLVAINGVDSPHKFDGTTWTTTSITGGGTLTNIAKMVERLWFTSANSASAWYLDTSSIAGALTEFPLGQIFTRGGNLIAMGTWTVDGGTGPDDYSVFASSEGQLAVYTGTDPGSADTFSKVGVFDVAPPLGKRCFLKFGGDLVYISKNGLFPLSKALQSASISRLSTLSSKIDRSFINAAQSGAGSTGWCGVVLPEKGLLLINVPASTDTTAQYVMNTVTNSWCKFTGWGAVTALGIFQSELYFTYPNAVAKGLSGQTDNGAAITCPAQQAYSTLGQATSVKHVKLVRPVFGIQESIVCSIGIATDFAEAQSLSQIQLAGTGTEAFWDDSAATWDDVEWTSGGQTILPWETSGAWPSYVAAIFLQLSNSGPTVAWSATNLLYEPGGLL